MGWDGRDGRILGKGGHHVNGASWYCHVDGATLMPANHRVIVISIDGFAAFYWNDPQARMPALRRLAERGVVAAGV